MTIDIRQLPADLRAALARGETIPLTDSGKVTARIVPEPPAQPSDEEAMQKAAALDAWVQIFARPASADVEVNRSGFYKEGDSD